MRTHYCGRVTGDLIGEEVSVCGWVHHRRDHGGVIFIDLRDYTGWVQVVADPDLDTAFAVADEARNEFVLRVTGLVRPRPQGTVNDSLATGAVEIVGREIEVLNRSDVLPFQLDENDVGEATRLKYRYLDLRRECMQTTLRIRHRVNRFLRTYLDDQDFIEVETPILTKSTPEGARDYLVPSRTQPGQFFALPQSPQLFKQLLMMSGCDRYYQLARCFRDEDLRADRQPEFTQLDVEMSFINEEDIMQLMEAMVTGLFKEILGVELPSPFPRISYQQAMDRFGSDRPDLRVPLELVELKDVMQDVAFKVFSGPANQTAGRVVALRVPGGGTLTRQVIDQYTAYVGQFGARGLAYIKVNTVAQGRAGLQSPIVKFLPDEVLQTVLERSGAIDGDLIFFGADTAAVVNDAMGALRVRLGHDLGLLQGVWRPLWVVDFPMFGYDAQAGRWTSLHHPFTAPKQDQIANLATAPGKVLSRAYDMVLNGSEIGGGSIRIHQSQVQKSVFSALAIPEDEAEEKFGFLLNALRYGAPPHGGIAFGLDRIVSMMVGADSIREVIAFPKTQKALCPLTQAPAVVDATQLRDLGIRLRKSVAVDKQQQTADN